MAKKNLKKKSKPKGYNPTASRYKKPGGLDRHARQLATSQIAPGMKSIESSRQQELGTSNRRIQDLGSWYGEAQNRAKAALERASAAMNNLMTTSGGANTDLQNQLAAGLVALNDRNDQLTSLVGGTPTDRPEDNQVLAALTQNSQTNQNALSGLGTAQLAALGSMEGNLGTGLVRAREGEQRNSASVLQGLSNDEGELRAQLPNLILQNRGQLEEGELQKQQARFNQGLAGKEFGLKSRGQKFNEGLAKKELSLKRREQGHREKIDWEQVSLSRGEQRNKTIEDKAAQDQENAKLYGEQWASGVEALNTFLTPTKHEVNKHGTVRKSYHQRMEGSFDQALAMLRGQVRMDPISSLRLMRDTMKGRKDPTSKRWYERASRMIKDHKDPKWRDRRDMAEDARGKLRGPGLRNRPPKSPGRLTKRPRIRK